MKLAGLCFARDLNKKPKGPSSLKLCEIIYFFNQKKKKIIKKNLDIRKELCLQFSFSHLFFFFPSTVFKLNVNYLGSPLIKKISNTDFQLSHSSLPTYFMKNICMHKTKKYVLGKTDSGPILLPLKSLTVLQTYFSKIRSQLLGSLSCDSSLYRC